MAQNLHLLDQITELLLSSLPPGPEGVGRALTKQYVIHRPLGCGAMGAVFYGEDVSLQVPVAIKVLSPALTYNRQILDRFLREARLLARIQSPNVVRVWSNGSMPEYRIYYFVMEYVDGVGLDELVRALHAPLSEGTALALLAKAARGLSAMHELGLLHRDFKPGNLLWPRGSSEVKVCDLGMAKEETSSGMSLTAASEVIGTPLYMAPEQARGSKHVDARADVYSLGATFFYLLTKSAPVRGDSLHQTLLNVISGGLLDAREMRPDISDRSMELLRILLAQNPDSRPESATAVMRLIESDFSLASDSAVSIATTFAGIEVEGEDSKTLLAERFSNANLALTSHMGGGGGSGSMAVTMAMRPPGESSADQATIIRKPTKETPAPRKRPRKHAWLGLRILLYAALIAAFYFGAKSYFKVDEAALAEASDYEASIASRTPQAYRTYLDRYAQGAHRAEISAALTAIENEAREDSAAWQSAAATDSVESYDQYLSQWRRGASAATARERRERIQADHDAYANATTEATAAEGKETYDLAAAFFDRYLENYPTGRHAAEAAGARARLKTAHEQAVRDDLAFEEARAQASGATSTSQVVMAMRALQRYLDAYPSGRHSTEASSMRSELQGRARAEGEGPYWNKVGERVETAISNEDYMSAISEYEAYLEIYAGDGTHLEDATAHIGNLNRRQERYAAAVSAHASASTQIDEALRVEDYPTAIKLMSDLGAAHAGAARVIDQTGIELEKLKKSWRELQAKRAWSAARASSESASAAGNFDLAITEIEKFIATEHAYAGEGEEARAQLQQRRDARERDLYTRATRDGADLTGRITAARRYLEIDGPRKGEINPLLTKLVAEQVSTTPRPCWVCGATNLRNHALCHNCGECILRMSTDPEGWKYTWDADMKLVRRERNGVKQVAHYKGPQLTDLIDENSENRTSFEYATPGVAGAKVTARIVRDVEHRIEMAYNYEGDRLKSFSGRAASLDPMFDERPTPSASATFTYSGKLMSAVTFEERISGKTRFLRKQSFTYEGENTEFGTWECQEAGGAISGKLRLGYRDGAAGLMEFTPTGGAQQKIELR